MDRSVINNRLIQTVAVWRWAIKLNGEVIALLSDIIQQDGPKACPADPEARSAPLT
jgi:hypothetical protein